MFLLNRELAKKYHPDLNKDDKNAAAKFKEVSEAYDVLEDENKRKQYDSFGHNAENFGQGFGGGNPFGQGFGGGFGGFGFGGFPGDFNVEFRSSRGGQGIDVEDLFDMFDMQMGQQLRPAKAAVRLSFLESVHGCTKDVKVDYITREQRRQVKNSKVVTVNIPPGIDNGMTIKVEGGIPNSNGKGASTDVYVSVTVGNDPYFRREGLDVHVELPVSLTQAILGSNIDVLTLDGMVSMKVPAGSQPDSKLMLKGKGVPDVTGQRRGKGNQYVTLKIQIPTNINERQKELLQEFEQVESSKGSGEKVFASVQDAWNRLKDFIKK